MPYTRVVIIGGGFGGLNAALSLKKANADILIIDKTTANLTRLASGVCDGLVKIAL